jgi:hypothetical protein
MSVNVSNGEKEEALPQAQTLMAKKILASPSTSARTIGATTSCAALLTALLQRCEALDPFHQVIVQLINQTALASEGNSPCENALVHRQRLLSPCRCRNFPGCLILWIGVAGSLLYANEVSYV